MRILIVEDDVFTRMEVEMTLQGAGHQVVGSVASFDEAITLVGSTAIDAAIVDLGLARGGSGFDLMRQLRTDHGIPSVVISGFIDPRLGERLKAF